MHTFIVIDSFICALIFGLETLEEMLSKLTKLLFLVIWGDDVKNKSNLLKIILSSRFHSIISFFGFFGKFSLFFIVCLEPRTVRVILLFVVILIGSTFLEVISIVLVVATRRSLVILTTFLLLECLLEHFWLSFNVI